MDNPSSVNSLFTLQQALESVRDHALRVRDTAHSSAVQLAGPKGAPEFKRGEVAHPTEAGIVDHLHSLAADIEAILSDCDNFAGAIQFLTGKWHKEEAEPQSEPKTQSTERQEPTQLDDADIAMKTGLADLVATVAAARA